MEIGKKYKIGQFEAEKFAGDEGNYIVIKPLGGGMSFTWSDSLQVFHMLDACDGSDMQLVSGVDMWLSMLSFVSQIVDDKVFSSVMLALDDYASRRGADAVNNEEASDETEEVEEEAEEDNK